MRFVAVLLVGSLAPGQALAWTSAECDVVAQSVKKVLRETREGPSKISSKFMSSLLTHLYEDGDLNSPYNCAGTKRVFIETDPDKKAFAQIEALVKAEGIDLTKEIEPVIAAKPASGKKRP